MQPSRKEITRRKVLDAAKMLFIEHGVEAVNMHQIAKAAQVGQASLYRQFTHKSDICAEIVSEECQDLIEEVSHYLTQVNEAPLDKLYQVIVYFVHYLESRIEWICVVTRASTNYQPIQSPLYQWMRKICNDILSDAVERKLIRTIDVPFTVEAILGTLDNIDAQLLYQGYSSERILSGIKNLFIEGLSKAQVNR